jgi:hypothetical protein
LEATGADRFEIYPNTVDGSLGLDDHALFEIVGTGPGPFVLKFITAPDFENPTGVTTNNEYRVEVRAYNSIGEDISNFFVITVTDVASPVWVTEGLQSVAENTTLVTALNAGAGATFEIVDDLPNGGADRALFVIFAGADFELKFKDANTPDFETPASAAIPASNIYTVIVTATIGAEIAVRTFTVTVTDVDEISGTPSSGSGSGSSTVTTPDTTPAPTPGFFSGAKWTITVDDAGVSTLDINLAKSQAGKNASFYKRTKQGKLILLDEEQRLGKNGKASITTDKLLRTGQKVRVQVDGKFRSTVTMP